MLVSASEPVPTPNGPAKIAPGSTPTLGKNRFKLIGVTAFNLPSRKDHTVVVQGLVIKATPESRLNVTSVTTMATTCAAQAK